MFHTDLTNKGIMEDFHDYVQLRIDDFSEDAKFDFKGKTLNELSTLPLQESTKLDYSTLEAQLDLEAAVYGMRLNMETAIAHMSQKILKEVFNVDYLNSVPSPISTKLELFENIFLNKHFYDQKFVSSLKKLESCDLMTFIPLFQGTNSTTDALSKFRSVNKSKTLEKELKKLSKEKVDMEVRYFKSDFSDKRYPNLMHISKEKIVDRYASKISRSVALNRLSGKLSPFDVAEHLAVDDLYGFSIVPVEAIPFNDVNSFDKSQVSRILEFVLNDSSLITFYDSFKDNYYFSNKRPMSGVQLYIAPVVGGTNQEISFPNPELIQDSTQLKSSFHIQDGKAYIEGQIGGAGIRPHGVYANQQYVTEQSNLDVLPPDLKSAYIGNVLKIKQTYSLEHLKHAFEADF